MSKAVPSLGPAVSVLFVRLLMHVQHQHWSIGVAGPSV